MLNFYNTLKSQITSWGIDENSNLYRDYFEQSIQGNIAAKNEYWIIRRRHPNWTVERIVRWMVKKLDKLEEEEVRKHLDRLTQGQSESISSFLERFQQSIGNWKLFRPISEEEESQIFLEKLRPATQRQIKLWGRPLNSVEEIFLLLKS